MFSFRRNQNINKRARCIVVDRESLNIKGREIRSREASGISSKWCKVSVSNCSCGHCDSCECVFISNEFTLAALGKLVFNTDSLRPLLAISNDILRSFVSFSTDALQGPAA